MANLTRIPGVYITEQPNAGLATTFSSYRSVGLIASGFPTLNKLDIAVTRGSTPTDEIPGFSASEVQSVLCVSSYINAYNSQLTKYVAGAEGDYTWTAGDNGNKIVWNSDHGPEEGDIYYVSITFEKQSAEYFLPTEFTSLQELQEAYEDVRILGKMGLSDRQGDNRFKNIYGEMDLLLF